MLDARWIVLLVAMPMATAVFTTFVRRRFALQRAVGLTSLAVGFALSLSWLLASAGGGMLVSQMGGWEAPYGISVVFDGLSGLLVTTTHAVAFGALLFASGTLSPLVERRWFHPLLHLLVMGVNFSLLTGDLFNLFVAFEIMLMASYALLCVGGSRQQLSQAYKYVMLNLIGSGFFVLGAGLVYGMMGTLNYADLARLVAAAGAGGEPLPAAFPAVAMMLLFVFALKAAVFPLWFWLPDTYHTCPISVSALFAGLLTKVGLYAMVRLLPMVLAAPSVRDLEPIVPILAIASGVTMLVAALCALGTRQIRRTLGLVLVSSIGFQAMGVAVMTDASLGGTVFYMVQSMLAIAALYLCCGIVERLTGTDNTDELGGLHRRAPWLSVLFFVAAISVVGLPPLSGFHAKALLLREGFRLDLGGPWWLLSLAGVAAGVLTLAALAKTWARTFWVVGSPPKRETLTLRATTSGLAPAYVAVVLLLGGAVGIGLLPQPLMEASLRAGASATNPRGYVVAVLGPDAWTDDGPTRTLATVDVEEEAAR